jgi:hypothetical protein
VFLGFRTLNLTLTHSARRQRQLQSMELTEF